MCTDDGKQNDFQHKNKQNNKQMEYILTVYYVLKLTVIKF